MSLSELTIGISPCPNDTFAFHGLMTGRVQLPGVRLSIELCDISELNRALDEARYDAAKGSFHAALYLHERYGILRSGAAIGFGVGPLLLGREIGKEPTVGGEVLCPGEWTTASLLLKLFYPDLRQRHCLFSDIMPALRAGEADFGVVIHEGRFSFQKYSLYRVADLGEVWEQETAAPLPLGGILCRRSLATEVISSLAHGLQESILYARQHPKEVYQTMREHAAELSEDALWRHIELYVNDATYDLDEPSTLALRQLGERALGVLPGVTDLDAFPVILG